jgi:hypothetical protein
VRLVGRALTKRFVGGVGDERTRDSPFRETFCLDLNDLGLDRSVQRRLHEAVKFQRGDADGVLTPEVSF